GLTSAPLATLRRGVSVILIRRATSFQQWIRFNIKVFVSLKLGIAFPIRCGQIVFFRGVLVDIAPRLVNPRIPRSDSTITTWLFTALRASMRRASRVPERDLGTNSLIARAFIIEIMTDHTFFFEAGVSPFRTLSLKLLKRQLLPVVFHQRLWRVTLGIRDHYVNCGLRFRRVFPECVGNLAPLVPHFGIVNPHVLRGLIHYVDEPVFGKHNSQPGSRVLTFARSGRCETAIHAVKLLKSGLSLFFGSVLVLGAGAALTDTVRLRAVATVAVWSSGGWMDILFRLHGGYVSKLTTTLLLFLMHTLLLKFFSNLFRILYMWYVDLLHIGWILYRWRTLRRGGFASGWGLLNMLRLRLRWWG